jgi:hypothetical protein
MGYSDDEVENNFLPAMALRDELDVAHVSLATFTSEQLGTDFRTMAKTAADSPPEHSWRSGSSALCLVELVGDTGIEPVTSSVSGKLVSYATALRAS